MANVSNTDFTNSMVNNDAKNVNNLFDEHFYYEEADLNMANELEAEKAEMAENSNVDKPSEVLQKIDTSGMTPEQRLDAIRAQFYPQAQQKLVAEEETQNISEGKKVELKLENGGKTDKQDELANFVKLEAEAFVELSEAKEFVNDCIAGKNLPEYFQFSDDDSKDKQKEFHAASLKRLEQAQDKFDILTDKTHAAKLSAKKVESNPKYKIAEKFEYVVDAEDGNIVARTRQQYVFLFKANERRTALATLDMCRTVYEANKKLKEWEFDDFCEKVGYKSNSSTIRKFLTIGKVYPRLVQYSEQLPVAWTNIYLLTQIPADDFEICVKQPKFQLKDLSGSEISELVKKTRDISDSDSPFKRDKKLMAYCVANVFFTKRVDDTDFRLLQKAFDEIASRLPVKLVIKKDVTEVFAARRAERYEKLKVESNDAMVKPEKWDYGFAANQVNGDTKQKLAA